MKNRRTVQKGKKCVTVQKGLLGLVGKRVTFFCMNYIYTGKLVSVEDDLVVLEEVAIVYETGPFSDCNWKDAQDLPKPVYIMRGSIESFMILK